MSYTILDALREEVDLLDQHIKYFDELEKKDKDSLSLGDKMVHNMWRYQKISYLRIVERFENGFDYNLGIKNGKATVIKTQTTRHLEREYLEVAEARVELDNAVQSANIIDKLQDTYKG